MRSRSGAAALLLLLLSACSTTPSRPDPTAAVDSASPDPSWPLSPAAYRTTSGKIYLDNLDARIAELRRVVAERGLAGHRASLAGSLYHRYRVIGRLADAEEALQLIDAAIAAQPDAAEQRQLRAVIRAGFHRFAEALQDLEAAAAGTRDPATLLRARHEVELALGDYQSLGEELRASADLSVDFQELAHRADLRLLQGDLAGATFLYRAAQAQYRDVNPVPLAWLHTQMGIALLRSGQTTEARRFFAAAVDRLPGYYLAEEHLAECEAALGETDAARARYRRVIEQTGNPEFIAALASVERQAGALETARDLEQQALAGYESLLAKHPAAFGQHAAEFLIEIGQEERADALARDNLGLRQDVGSWILQAHTALALGDTARACAARNAAVQTALRPPELAELDALAPRCR